MSPRALAAATVAIALAATLALGLARRGSGDGARCGPGFRADGWRCAFDPSGGCPRPLVASSHGCDAPDERVLVPEATLAIGPSDWEAEGVVGARVVHAGAFRIDAFEVTVGKYAGGASLDAARAASGMSRDDAAAFCASRGGRLPTEDEWTVAAASAADPPARYPWGDTGAVCRRAAWGLADGPCATGAGGPDTVGAHPGGDTRLGIHDLAGNVAEWVAPPPPGSSARPAPPGMGVAKGGSWRSELASGLRVWARLELPYGRGDPRVGFRCAYAP